MKRVLLVLAAALIASSVAFAAGPWKFAFYVPAPHPYFEAVKVGVEAFAKEYGIQVREQVGPDWNMDSENTGVLALAAEGYNLFSIYPSDVSAANGLYDELIKRGAFVVNEGGPTSLPTPASFFVSTNTKGAATQAAEFVIGKMGKKGTLVDVLELLEDGNTKTRRDAVMAVSAKYPQVKVMEVAGIHNEQEAIEKIEGAVAAAGGFVDGIITTGYVPTVALAKFLTDYETKNKKHIHAIGIDDDPVTLKGITDGYLDATVAQNPYGHGYLTMLALKYLSEGWKPRPDGYFIDAGIVIVTKDNVTSYSKDLQKVTAQIKADMTKKYLMQ
jgi:ribose transport system substrate-binding protein